jgi:protein phosphatase
MMQKQMENRSICPSCAQEYRPDARFCPSCGRSLAEPDKVSDQQESQDRRGVLASVKQILGAQHEERPTSLVDEGGGAMARSGLLPWPTDSVIVDRYRTIQAYPLATCIYYDAAEPSGNEIKFLVRETPERPKLSKELSHRLRGLSQQGMSQVLSLLQILYSGDRSYTVVAHPGLGWRNLGKVPVPVRPLRQVIDWTLQIGKGLQTLHQAGLCGWPPGLAGREALLILPDNTAWLADLSLCRPLNDEAVEGDIRVLASLIHYLASGGEPDPQGQTGQLPGELHQIVRRGISGAYPDLGTMLDELSRSTSFPLLERELRQSAGNATHPGRVRDLNQDFVATLTYSLDQSGRTAPVGLYIVADGMGGHMAGELASKGSARQAFMQFIEQRLLPGLKGTTQRLNRQDESINILKTLIRQANQLVYHSRQASGSDRGTTMTAAIIIGDQAVVANVGDSRTYLVRHGRLEQITQDHSLVASLVQAGQIQPEELYSHPDRHQIYRSLGDKAEIEVDVFQCRLQKGDRLLLCSDGLWEMVRGAAISETLAKESSAQAACDRLIDQANAGGGEDNISVIVVDMA